MAVRNMGRVQGASMFYTTLTLGTNDTVISTDDLIQLDLKPFIADTVVDCEGELFIIVNVDGSKLTLQHQSQLGTNLYIQLDIIDGNLLAYTDSHRVQDFSLQNGKLYLEVQDG